MPCESTDWHTDRQTDRHYEADSRFSQKIALWATGSKPNPVGPVVVRKMAEKHTYYCDLQNTFPVCRDIMKYHTLSSWTMDGFLVKCVYNWNHSKRFLYGGWTFCSVCIHTKLTTYRTVPIPVASRSKVWVWGCSLAGVTGSNPGGVVEVCLVWLLCVVR